MILKQNYCITFSSFLFLVNKIDYLVDRYKKYKIFSEREFFLFMDEYIPQKYYIATQFFLYGYTRHGNKKLLCVL